MERKIVLTILLTLFGGWAVPSRLLAQHEWDNFAIGRCLLVNLADTVPRFDTSPEAVPGMLYTCLVQGGELVLTDPRTGQLQVCGGFNRKFEPLASGSGVGGWGCPVPGDESSWFIMGHSESESGCIRIDMRGDSGLGAVTTAFAFSKSFGLPGSALLPASDGYHYWFITPGPCVYSGGIEHVDSEFHSYLISSDGPSPVPVVSKFPWAVGGQLYGSPDGSTLAMGGIGFLRIFHVDRTGKILFFDSIETGYRSYRAGYFGSDVAFSPDSKVLYFATKSDSFSYLLQYDLTRLNANSVPYVVAKSVDTNETYNAPIAENGLALVGNSRIYGSSSYMRPGKGGVPIDYSFSIDTPDSLGPACRFDDTAFSPSMGIWNGVPRVVHSRLTQISAISLRSCQSSCYSFSRPDSVTGYPHWSFEGGMPATASGPTVPQVCFDSAGPHPVFATTSAGDTLFTLAVAGVPSGTALPLYDGMYDLYRQATDSANATVAPGSIVAIPIHLKLGYTDNPDQTGDTIGHLLREYVLNFDTNILSLQPGPDYGIYLSGDEYEISSVRQTGNTLTIVIGDTGGVESTSWWAGGASGGIPWKDTMDAFRIAFHVTKSNNWSRSSITFARFSIDDGFGSRLDFCPVENDLLATVTNAQAGVSVPTATSSVTLYPNPTTGMVTINGASGPVAVENILGERVYIPHATTPQPPPLTEEGECTLDLSRLPAGTYFVRVTGQDGRATVRRIVKE